MSDPSLEGRNITVGSRRTSMKLEPQLWTALAQIAERESISINNICTKIDRHRGETGLTSSVRMFIIGYFRHLANYYESHHTQTTELPDGRIMSVSGPRIIDQVISKEIARN